MHRYSPGYRGNEYTRIMAYTRPPEPQPFRSLLAFLLLITGITLVGFGMNNPYAVKVVHTVQEVTTAAR